MTDSVHSANAETKNVQAREAPVVEAKAAAKASVAAYNEMNSNCNTCADFQRLPHEKEALKFVRGKCGYAPARHPLMYRKSGTEFWVHPTDCMDMECWAPRAPRTATDGATS